MDLTPISTKTNSGEIPLRGLWLRLLQVLWGLLVFCDLFVLFVSLPAFYRGLHAICVTLSPSCQDDQLTPQAASVLQHAGFSIHTYALYVFSWDMLVTLAFLLVGTVIIWRRANTWMGLFVSFLLVSIGSFVLHATALDGVPVDNAFVLLATIVEGPLTILAYLGLGFFFFTFPDGRFIPRWSWALISLWLANFAFWLAPVNSPLTIFGWPPLLKYLWLFLVFGGSLATQVYRYRRVASEVERQQIKWLIYGLVPTLLLPICFQLAVALFPALDSPGALLRVSTEPLWRFYFLPIPFCIGIALLRYRLWDIDVLINRTLVYGTLTMSVIGLYMLVVVSLGSLVQAQGNLLLSLLATGFIAVLFQPLRAFLQRGINRLLYGLRDEPYVVLARLGQRLKTTLDPDAVLSTIVATVREALKLSYAAIEVREGTALALAASSGTPPAQETLRLPLAYQSEPVGTLIIAPRGRDDSLTPADLRLLDDLTQQIGNAVHTVRLTSDLQRSREHLVTAREEERRRLRRDLHDGLGPMLSAIMLKVGLVRTLHRRDPETTDALLDQLEAEIESVIGDIRRVVYNLRPPALDELGLVGAIREYVARLGAEAQGHDVVLTVTVEAPEHLPALPAAVEVAAYRIVQEALTNVLRHAHAQSCRVRFLVEEALQIEVSDDGTGFEEAQQAGVGLTSMRERAEELGGTFTIQKTAPGGTQVTACLPLSHATRERAHV